MERGRAITVTEMTDVISSVLVDLSNLRDSLRDEKEEQTRKFREIKAAKVNLLTKCIALSNQVLNSTVIMSCLIKLFQVTYLLYMDRYELFRLYIAR